MSFRTHINQIWFLPMLRCKPNRSFMLRLNQLLVFCKLSTMCCAEWSLKCSSAEKLPKIGCAVCRIENNEHASLLHNRSRVIVRGLIPSQNDETKHETLASNNFQTLFVAWSWQFASCFFASVRQATFGNTLKRNRRSSKYCDRQYGCEECM